MQPSMYSDLISFFETNDPVIATVLKQDQIELPQPILDPADYFSRLLRNIVGQQLSIKAAETIWNRFDALFDHDPTPEQVLESSETSLREVGLSRSKVTYVKDLASHVQDNQLPFSEFKQMSDTEIIAQLVQVKGIGIWTAEMFLIFSLGREDVFSFGDLGLLRGLQKLYGIGEKPAAEEIEAITTNWQPYRTYGSLALWESVAKK